MGIAQEVPRWGVVIFSIALVYQAFHWLEHAVQMYQHAVYKLSVLHSHGILFYLDLEWNHFVFNVLYVAALIAVVLGGRLYRREMLKTYPIAVAFILLSLSVQSWHLVEHSVRIAQHLVSGCEPCMGILGTSVDVIYLHGSYNALTFFLPLCAYVTGGFHRRLWDILWMLHIHSRIKYSKSSYC